MAPPMYIPDLKIQYRARKTTYEVGTDPHVPFRARFFLFAFCVHRVLPIY